MARDARRRYVSGDEDSRRWDGLALRDDDIVVSTRSKHGTTWMQAVLLHLVHGPDELPEPLATLSPWLDHLVEPVDAVLARLEGQRHRRVIKTHTPLDGVPDVEGVTYVVVARHPLDAAVSLFHHMRNLDRRRMAELTGRAAGAAGPPPDGLAGWLRRWVDADPDPQTDLDSLPGVAHHLRDAWDRRRAPGVHLVRYADLHHDPHGEVRRLARILGTDPVIDGVVAATSFTAMRDRAAQLVPDPVGIVRDPTAFFRSGRTGEGQAIDPLSLERYRQRIPSLLPPDLLSWLHGPPGPAGP